MNKHQNFNLNNIIYEEQYKIKLGVLFMFLTQNGFIVTIGSILYLGLNIEGVGLATFLMFALYKYNNNLKYYEVNQLPHSQYIKKLIMRKK